MRTVSKKLFSLLLVAIMLVSVIPFQAFAASADGSLTLDAKGGKINGAKTATYDTWKGKKIGYKIDELPTPKRSGYTFKGWYIGDKLIELGTKVTWTGNKTATAKWKQQTYNLTVKIVLDGDPSTAKTVYSESVPKGTPLLDWLKEEVEGTFDIPKGYTWANKYWYDYSGSQPLTSQKDKMDQAQTIYINCKAKTYTLFFNAKGGKVDPTSKEVKFNHTVGKLPTPTKKGMVFLGWKDEDSGKEYTKDAHLKVARDVTLTAQWAPEETVLLRIYLNGNTSTPDRIVEMAKYISDQNVTRKAVEKIVNQYYSASGGALKLDGLFTDDTWASYKKNTKKEGVPTVQVTDEEHLTNVYVMVHNAKQGGSTPASNNNGYVSKTPSDPSNPKTGDNAYIYTAAAVMVVAAAGYVTMELLRKRKMI